VVWCFWCKCLFSFHSLYAEMICFECAVRLPYLHNYIGLVVTKVEREDKKVDDGTDAMPVHIESEANDVLVKTDNVDNKNSNDDVGSSEDSIKEKKTSHTMVCPLTKPSPDISITSSMFLPLGWRSSLCKCPSCTQLYKDTNTSFLTEESDTVHHYESQARDKKGTLEQGMEALSQMDRVKQVEAIHSYNNMKQNLMEYLAKFADSKKVVREDDIRTFFEGMKGNKKFKPDGGPPPSCK